MGTIVFFILVIIKLYSGPSGEKRWVWIQNTDMDAQGSRIVSGEEPALQSTQGSRIVTGEEPALQSTQGSRIVTGKEPALQSTQGSRIVTGEELALQSEKSDVIYKVKIFK